MKEAKELRRPLRCKNVDGTYNKKGKLTHQIMVTYTIEKVEMKDLFFITNLTVDSVVPEIPPLYYLNKSMKKWYKIYSNEWKKWLTFM